MKTLASGLKHCFSAVLIIVAVGQTLIAVQKHVNVKYFSSTETVKIDRAKLPFPQVMICQEQWWDPVKAQKWNLNETVCSVIFFDSSNKTRLRLKYCLKILIG